MTPLIDIIAGTRPNFVKLAPVIHEMQRQIKNGAKLQYRLIHTGQHYDKNMSDIFFEELDLPAPDVCLSVEPGDSSYQITEIIRRYKSHALSVQRPDFAIVAGDVSSTLAGALAIKKHDPGIPLAHVEAGLRCGDNSMPEEINRIITDSISDYFFTTTPLAKQQLLASGVQHDRIFCVGNTMIDTLYSKTGAFRKPSLWQQHELTKGKYIILTLHRQANISNKDVLDRLLTTIGKCAGGLPVLFPAHPHTIKMIHKFKIKLHNIILTPPLGYLEFNYLTSMAKAVVTDSGGVSEETTVMNIPCITLRDTTERPETCDMGTNVLVGHDLAKIKAAFEQLLDKGWHTSTIPALWDGMAGKRIVSIIMHILSKPISMKSCYTHYAASKLKSIVTI